MFSRYVPVTTARYTPAAHKPSITTRSSDVVRGAIRHRGAIPVEHDRLETTLERSAIASHRFSDSAQDSVGSMQNDASGRLSIGEACTGLAQASSGPGRSADRKGRRASSASNPAASGPSQIDDQAVVSGTGT